MKENKEIISYLKDKGFVFAGSSIYGGLANSWDYGPLGTMLKNNIKTEWKNFFIDREENIFHLDSSIMLNSKVWEASGHVRKFNDPMVDCKNCMKRFRSDHLIEQNTNIENAENLSFEEQDILLNNISCPNCKSKNWTNVKEFKLMFKIQLSKNDNSDEIIYLRPETAQGIFINFKNVVNTLNAKIPFGIGQIGKAFRNEVTPGNFIFRTKEFEQMEMQFFIKEENSQKWFDYFENKISFFLNSILNINLKNIKKYKVKKDSLPHYAKKVIDFEYNFPFGWGEIIGLHNRGDFDLKKHSKYSIENMEYFDQLNNIKFIPHVIEVSFGVDRLLFAITVEHLKTEKIKNGERDVFKLPFNLAPYKASIMPLTNKLEKETNLLFHKLLNENIGPINFSKSGSIGKRYRKQDAIGTMFSITYDFNSKTDGKVTIRDRDTMNQERILIKDIKKYILENAK